MFLAMFARSYAVTALRGYDQVVAAAITAIAVIAAIAVGGCGRRGRLRGGRGRQRAGVGSEGVKLNPLRKL